MTEPLGFVGIVYLKGKYLLIKDKKTGGLLFPMGRKGPQDKSVLYTLIRDVRTLTGLGPKDYRLINTPVSTQGGYAVYLLETGGSIKSSDPDVEIAGWFDADGVLGNLSYPELKDVFKKAVNCLKS